MRAREYQIIDWLSREEAVELVERGAGRVGGLVCGSFGRDGLGGNDVPFGKAEDA